MDNDSHGDAPDGHGDCQRLPAIAMPQKPHSEPTQAERDAQQERDIRDLKRRERILFRVAVLGAVIAAVSAAISTLQWKAAAEAVEVARRQLDDAKAVTYLQYRPWLLTRSARFDRIYVRMELTNAGQTPASDVQMDAFINLVDASPQNAQSLLGMGSPPVSLIPPQPKWADRRMLFKLGDIPQVRRTPLVLAPGETIPVSWDVMDAKSVRAQVNSSAKYLMIIGRIFYRDTFGFGRRTEYCYYITGQDLASGTFQPCAGNNKDRTQQQGEPYTPYE
jgi:hypothetical protein